MWPGDSTVLTGRSSHCDFVLDMALRPWLRASLAVRVGRAVGGRTDCCHEVLGADPQPFATASVRGCWEREVMQDLIGGLDEGQYTADLAGWMGMLQQRSHRRIVARSVFLLRMVLAVGDRDPCLIPIPLGLSDPRCNWFGLKR